MRQYPLASHWSRLAHTTGPREETLEHGLIEFEGGQLGIFHWTNVGYDSALRWWRSSRFLAEKGMSITVGVNLDVQEQLSLLAPGGEAPRFITLERRWERVDGGALAAMVAHTGDEEMPIVQWENPFRPARPGHGVQWSDDEIGVAGCLSPRHAPCPQTRPGAANSTYKGAELASLHLPQHLSASPVLANKRSFDKSAFLRYANLTQRYTISIQEVNVNHTQSLHTPSSQSWTRVFNRYPPAHLFCLTLLVFSILLSACTPTATPAPAPTQPPASTATSMPIAQPAAAAAVLKLEGPSGAKTLTMVDLKALPATEGWAGIKSSTGKITVPEPYNGVALDELCKLVGGISPNTGVNLVAKDGYAMTVSYDQITQGGFITYDPGTGDEVKVKDPLTVVIAYEKGGKPLPEDTEGPLKLVVVSAKNNQVVDGHWAVKWINQITIKSLAQEWKLPLGGAITEDMDRGTFQSCAAPACHGKTWTDGKAQIWTGVPLWLLAGRVDDEVKHGDGAYNDKLADQGYPVHVVAVDGYKVALESARIKRNGNILVAYLVNGNPLDDKDFPLRLVGSDLQPNEMVGRIAKINLMLAATQSASTPMPAETPKPAAAVTAAPAAAGNAALTINGAVDKPQTLTMDSLKGMQVVTMTADHPKKGTQTYEGVRLNALLDQAQVKSGSTKLVMTSSDGFTSEVSLADVRKCTDCLLAFNAGKLDAVMPGMQSSFWAKDVIKIEIK